jgi:hypothetical protein
MGFEDGRLVIRCFWVVLQSVLTRRVIVPQLEGLALVLRSLTSVQQTPGLETPQYTVLRRTAEYEVGL